MNYSITCVNYSIICVINYLCCAGDYPPADVAIQAQAFGDSTSGNIALKGIAWVLLIIRPLFFVFMLVSHWKQVGIRVLVFRDVFSRDLSTQVPGGCFSFLEGMSIFGLDPH